MKTYRWEIIPMEGESTFILTSADSVLVAAQTFEENYGNHISIYAIRKAAEIIEFEEAV
ncbi:hypothetical protein [Sporosarcina sp. FSL K6-3508]|uniref:hypothetical protein n=1 Tax=Sporosarcina sp. FSL K6-3508 TaxID=2921557 RepID=UPI003159E771